MKKRKRPYKPSQPPSEAKIAEIDAMLKAHRDQHRREMPADVAFYYERIDGGCTSKQACFELLRSGLLRDRGLSGLVSLHLYGIPDDQENSTLALYIARHVKLVTELLEAAGCRKGARTKAAWHAVHHWRGVRHFNTSDALLKWVGRNLDEEL